MSKNIHISSRSLYYGILPYFSCHDFMYGIVEPYCWSIVTNTYRFWKYSFHFFNQCTITMLSLILQRRIWWMLPKRPWWLEPSTCRVFYLSWLSSQHSSSSSQEIMKLAKMKMVTCHSSETRVCDWRMNGWSCVKIWIATCLSPLIYLVCTAFNLFIL